MFLRLCGPPSIPLSFSLAAVLPRWMTYRFRLAREALRPRELVIIVYCVDYQGI